MSPEYVLLLCNTTLTVYNSRIITSWVSLSPPLTIYWQKLITQLKGWLGNERGDCRIFEEHVMHLEHRKDDSKTLVFYERAKSSLKDAWYVN